MKENQEHTDNEAAVSRLYQDLLAAWNRRSAADYAAHFDETGRAIGFDGSMMNGRAAIQTELKRIFAEHLTAAYFGKVRDVRILGEDAAILQAVAGMRPPGQADLNPAVSAIHTLVAVKGAEGWKIVLFQNTPAQFHGRPDLAEALTAELSALLKASDE